MIKSRSVPKPRGPSARALGALLLAGGITLGLGQSASAQFAFDDAVLPPRVIAWRLADRGFSGMTRPRYDGRVYVVEAVNPAGIPVRLFVDPEGGAIVGRQRLGGGETYARGGSSRQGFDRQDFDRRDLAGLERSIPGYGWTQEDDGPRGALRPLPPEDASGPTQRSARRSGAVAARPKLDPDGANPDANTRREPPRKLARATPPSRLPEPKPALRTTPEAPAPKLAPVETATPVAKPEAPSVAVDKMPPVEAPHKAVPVDGARADAGKAAPDWKDPPAEGKRPVRVIEGATVVPGTSENKDKDATQ